MSKKYNLGHINTLDDLQKEVRLVNTRIKQRETELKSRWERLPQETIKATLGSVIPFFLRHKVAGTTWTLIKSVFGLVAGGKAKKDDSGNWKDFIMGNAKQLGLMALLKGVMNLVAKKRAS